MNNTRIFYPGKYYIVDEENIVQGEYETMYTAKMYATESDTILIAVNHEGSHLYTPVLPRVNKVIVDFTKKILTIDGECININGNNYSKGTYKLGDNILANWSKLLEDSRKGSKELVIKGTPPIIGKDITDEMSDL